MRAVRLLMALSAALWCTLVLAQQTPIPPVNDNGQEEYPELVLDRPEARLVDTAYAEAPPSRPALPDTSAGFFKKIFHPGYPNPERSAALSLVLPGAGQIYNKRFAYIKVPIIYAGYAALIYSGETNRKLKNRYELAVQQISDGEETEFEGERFNTAANLRIRSNGYSKNYQLAYIGVVILHLVQTLEAYTTAHLLNFDMDESLSLRPTLNHLPAATGFGVSRPALAVTWTLP